MGRGKEGDRGEENEKRDGDERRIGGSGGKGVERKMWRKEVEGLESS